MNQLTYPHLPVHEAQLRILEDTLEFYGEDPAGRRSTTLDSDGDERCLYEGPNGQRCALGRLCPDTKLKEGKNAYHDSLMFDLPPDVRRLGASYLVDLQIIHDGQGNWQHPVDKMVSAITRLLEKVDQIPADYSIFIGPFTED